MGGGQITPSIGRVIPVVPVEHLGHGQGPTPRRGRGAVRGMPDSSVIDVLLERQRVLYSARTIKPATRQSVT